MLGGASSLSLLALWMPSAPRVVPAADRATAGDSQLAPPPRPLQAAGVTTTSPPLPARLPILLLEPAKRDFFALEEPKPQEPAKTAAVAPPPPPPPAPPSMPYKVVGVMLDPDGRRLVVLGKPDKSLIVAPGMQLDEGFVVESVDEATVQLVYPALDTRFQLPIPRSPQP